MFDPATIARDVVRRHGWTTPSHNYRRAEESLLYPDRVANAPTLADAHHEAENQLLAAGLVYTPTLFPKPKSDNPETPAWETKDMKFEILHNDTPHRHFALLAAHLSIPGQTHEIHETVSTPDTVTIVFARFQPEKGCVTFTRDVRHATVTLAAEHSPHAAQYPGTFHHILQAAADNLATRFPRPTAEDAHALAAGILGGTVTEITPAQAEAFKLSPGKVSTQDYKFAIELFTPVLRRLAFLSPHQYAHADREYLAQALSDQLTQFPKRKTEA